MWGFILQTRTKVIGYSSYDILSKLQPAMNEVGPLINHNHCHKYVHIPVGFSY